jgi:hypothetical protein
MRGLCLCTGSKCMCRSKGGGLVSDPTGWVAREILAVHQPILFQSGRYAVLQISGG